MDALVEHLSAALGRGQILSAPDELLVYECDGLTQYKVRPRAVVFPHSTEEVAEVVRVVTKAGVSFAPRGAGTGLSGGALALGGGVVIELARMRRLIKLDVENRLAVVETGLVNAQLTRAAAPHGLHYAPDPSSQATCTIGGNVAENAGGIHCLKYGTTVDHVIAARVVLPDGEIADLRWGEASGSYDLLGLFVGSEGTFGIATEATVKLTPLAPSVRTLLADFTNIDDASRAVSAIIAEGLIPAALEMIDGATIRAVEQSVFAAGLPVDAEAALLVELNGLDAGLDEEAARAEEICLRHGARRCRRAADELERKKLWAARKGAFGAMGRISPDLMLQDAVVPRSRLPEVLAQIYLIGVRHKLRVANVFHAGDGNLHPFICFDARDREEVGRVHAASREIMETCVRAGGTITGEHGVGLDKRAYLPLIFSDDDLDAMLRVRAAFDPSGLCNPGKIIPAPRGCGEARAAATRFPTDINSSSTIKASPAEASQASLAHLSNLTSRSNSNEATHAAVSPPPAVAREHARAAFHTDEAPKLFAGIVGKEHVTFESFDGLGESLVVAPASAEEVCEVLRAASREGLRVVPAGSGSWLDDRQLLTPRASRVVVSTRRMTRIVEHTPADLVATVESGLTLGALNEELSRAKQWLPLDPPGDRHATLGGVAASGLSGAQAFGYGAPRAYVLGLRAALADGRVIKAGGRVVKNVAGYDLCKLFVGSRGTLGVLTELTFKLRPRPEREATVITRSPKHQTLLDAARRVLDSNLMPVAVELLSPRAARQVGAADGAEDFALLARFAGTARGVAFQTEQAHNSFSRNIDNVSVEVVEGDENLWRGLAALSASRRDELVWRASVLPFALGSFVGALENVAGESFRESSWQACAGSGRLRVIAAESGQGVVSHASEIKRLRECAWTGGGSLVVENCSTKLRALIASHDFDDATTRLMARIKHQLDPQGLFPTPGQLREHERRLKV